MSTLDTGKEKIRKICEILKNETLEPAKEEAQKVIELAQEQAHGIIRDAHKQAEDLLSDARAKMEKEKQLFQTSLKQASKQGLEALRQDIENKLFNEELSGWLEKQTADPKVAAKLITALVEAVKKEGTSADFSALIPVSVSAEQVNKLLAAEIVKTLREKSVIVGEFFGGAKLKLHDRQLTLDLSDEALKELLGQYVRKDFRRLLFQTEE